MTKLESGLADIAALSPLPCNPKRHDLNVLGRSYQRWGFVDRILVNRQTGHLISGHGRIEALLALKADGQPPPGGIEARDGAWLVPVDYVSIPEGEEMALAIALNRTVELGGWDDEALAEVLRGLADAPGGLDGVGFGEADLDALLKLACNLDSLDSVLNEHRLQPASREAVTRPVILVSNVETFERAIERTGQMNRGEALIELCRFYLENNKA